MIPFRNQYNQIVGWQVRVDEVKNSVHVKSGPTGIQAELVQQPNVVKITKNEDCIYEGKLEIGKNKELLIDGEKVVVKIHKGQNTYGSLQQTKMKELVREVVKIHSLYM